MPDRLGAIEARLTAIEAAITRLADGRSRFLIGWDQIARAVGKSPRTVRRYARFGFPACRMGRQRISSVEMISSWLLEVEAGRLRGTIPRYTSMKRKGITAA